MKKLLLIAITIPFFITACGEKIPPKPVPLTKAVTGHEVPCEQFTYYGFPLENHIEKKNYFICRDGYALDYNPDRRTANWVVELLTAKNLTKKDNHKNIDDTRPDPEIDPTLRTNKNDYKGTGYEMGRFISPKDFAYNDVMFSQAHYLSNSMPINPTEIKAWKTLNELVRKEAIKRKKLFVVSGPVYLNSAGLGWVGLSSKLTSSSAKTANRGKIEVPTYYFKALFDPLQKESIAYIVSNKTTKKAHIQAISVSKLEKATGLHFLSDMEKQKAQKIKSQYQPNKWLK